MKDRMKESLSALCDGECDELEVRRILNQVGNQSDLRDQWQRYHLIGSVLRDEPTSSVDLLKGINQALDGEPMDEVPATFQQSADHNALSSNGNNSATTAVRSAQGISQWFISGAVAASVTLAVLVGFRMSASTDMPSSALVSQSAPAPAPAPVTAAQTSVAVAMSEAELREAQEALQNYMLGNQSRAPVYSDTLLTQSPAFARVANYGKETEVESEN